MIWKNVHFRELRPNLLPITGKPSFSCKTSATCIKGKDYFKKIQVMVHRLLIVINLYLLQGIVRHLLIILIACEKIW